ncbi:hypothetical protein [Legionella impletisoli]|uniref:Integral membrane protein (PIN domain superfamily) n=1 Tax=Legionella impletisoli TaxID=343510 RepID=A0A917NDF2_9GAMM|nr:hypothetical protein [Legionella impletisoli]GGI87054.1 hypothetical protein GCM10007966_14690 [Legionella impletisoli]
MNITLFLAEVIGWYFVIVSLFVLVRRRKMEAILLNIASQPSLILILGIITIILGLLMVVSHNIWVMDWPVLITLISWLVLLSGLFRLLMPEWGVNIANWWFTHQPYLIAVTVLYLLIGLFLLYKAFTV